MVKPLSRLCALPLPGVHALTACFYVGFSPMKLYLVAHIFRSSSGYSISDRADKLALVKDVGVRCSNAFKLCEPFFELFLVE